MEYDTDPAFSAPQSCGEVITGGLAAGTYYVHCKATDTNPAGEAAEIVIGYSADQTETGDGAIHVTAAPDAHGSITLSEDTLSPGGDMLVTIRPEDGYLLDAIFVNDEEVPLHGRFTRRGLTSDTRIEVRFVPRPSEAEWKNLFKDVSERDWFFDDVSYACRSRWMNGVAEDRFDLKMPLNRAAFVTVLYRFDLMPESPESSFTDVPDNTWHTEAVGWASDAGIVNGVGHSQYAPLDDITREQMAAILYRYMNYRGLDVSAKDDADLSGFIDADEIYDYAADAVRWAVGCGLLQGRGNGVLAPRGTATRAEVATVFHRLEAVVKAAEALAADPA